MSDYFKKMECCILRLSFVPSSQKIKKRRLGCNGGGVWLIDKLFFDNDFVLSIIFYFYSCFFHRQSRMLGDKRFIKSMRMFCGFYTNTIASSSREILYCIKKECGSYSGDFFWILFRKCIIFASSNMGAVSSFEYCIFFILQNADNAFLIHCNIWRISVDIFFGVMSNFYCIDCIIHLTKEGSWRGLVSLDANDPLLYCTHRHANNQIIASLYSPMFWFLHWLIASNLSVSISPVAMFVNQLIFRLFSRVHNASVSHGHVFFRQTKTRIVFIIFFGIIKKWKKIFFDLLYENTIFQ